MGRKRIESEVAGYLQPILDDYKYEMVDIEYIKEGPRWYLRIFIDKPGGITVVDCEKVSRELETILDEKDPIEGSYILEVSSPGLDRPLKKEADYIRSIGKVIDIKLYAPRDNQQEFQGELKDFKDNTVTIISEDNENISFNLKDIAVARPAIIF